MHNSELLKVLGLPPTAADFEIEAARLQLCTSLGIPPETTDELLIQLASRLAPRPTPQPTLQSAQEPVKSAPTPKNRDADPDELAKIPRRTATGLTAVSRMQNADKGKTSEFLNAGAAPKEQDDSGRQQKMQAESIRMRAVPPPPPPPPPNPIAAMIASITKLFRKDKTSD